MGHGHPVDRHDPPVQSNMLAGGKFVRALDIPAVAACCSQ